MSFAPPRWLYFGITFAVILVDQASKRWAYTVLRTTPGRTKSVIANFFDLSYAENPGIAFSLFNSGEAGTKMVLLGIACCAALGIGGYSFLVPRNQWRMLTILALILGGIIGNAIDRAVYGSVIDFIDVYVGNSHFPTFNIADSAISVGAFFLAVEAFFFQRHPAPETASQPENSVTEG
jgi:signal peptidase II